MNTPSPDEILAWHRANVGLSGRSKDPAKREGNRALLMPFDKPKDALSTLDHWIDAVTKQIVIMSTCALYAMAYLRWLGVVHALLTRPYLGHNDCTLIVPKASGALWIGDRDKRLLELPAVGNILRIGMDGEAAVHFVCIAGYDAPSGALIGIAGGGGDGSVVTEKRFLYVVPNGIPYLVDADTPYIGNTPNGRRVSGRSVVP